MNTLIVTQNILNALTAISFWLLFGVILTTVTPRTKVTWLVAAFFFTFALGMTLEVQSVYLWFNGWIGINNLAWLIALSAITIAVYLIAYSYYVVMEQTMPRWALFVCLTSLITYIFIWRHIAASPEQTNHAMPTSLAQLNFLQLFIFNAILYTTLVASAIWYLHRQEEAPINRLRSFMTLIVCLLGILFLFIRFILHGVGWATPTAAIVTPIYAMAIIVQIIAGTIIPALFLPNERLHPLIQCLTWADKVLNIYTLYCIQTRLDKFCNPIVPQINYWHDILRDPTYHEYRAIIDILDRKTILKAYLTNFDEPTSYINNHIAFRRGDKPAHWNATVRQEAQTIYHLLQQVDDEAPFDQIVKAYRKIGRQIS